MLKVIQVAHHHKHSKLPAIDTITLSFDQRQCRRTRLQSDHGHEVILDLPQTIVLAQGDGLHLEDGSWIEVQEANEPILDIFCENSLQLARIAWHLGNRHCLTQFLSNGLRIRFDSVLEKMLHGLGVKVENQNLPFSPESGAYNSHHPHE